MTDPERLAALAELRVPFDRAQIGRMPRGGVQLDYVGHANTTARLLNVDPEWTWEPVAYDDHGLPALMYHDGKPVGLWIRLTVCGVTRLGYGSCAPGKADAVKELIGDALRNAAMRFGVALDLWSKEELETPHEPAVGDEVGPSSTAMAERARQGGEVPGIQSGGPTDSPPNVQQERSAAGGQSEPTPNQAGDVPAAQASAPPAHGAGTQADTPQPAQAAGEARQTQAAASAASPPRSGVQRQQALLWVLAQQKYGPDAQAALHDLIRAHAGRESTRDLTPKQRSEIIDLLQALDDYTAEAS